jgi:cytochrome bd ubiquinol oxidase subunit II
MNAVAAAGCLGLLALGLYAILGGADFGGGVLDLIASGPRRTAQHHAVSHAIGPIWEANHVWLIFALVLLFTCFPRAFADISVGLYAPLTLALVGIVLRGAAFVFRNYAADDAAFTHGWTAVFGIASLLAPFFFGDTAGALASGRYAWTSPFALTVGLFAVTLCAQIAAVFILPEIPPGKLCDDFRRRALRMTVAIWIIGLLPALVAAATEPALLTAFLVPRVLTVVAFALLAGIAVLVLVAFRNNTLARIAVALETIAILGAWFLAQAPQIVPGHDTYASAAAEESMIVAFLIATAAGSVLLIPSLALLYTVFKGPRST